MCCVGGFLFFYLLLVLLLLLQTIIFFLCAPSWDHSFCSCYYFVDFLIPLLGFTGGLPPSSHGNTPRKSITVIIQLFLCLQNWCLISDYCFPIGDSSPLSPGMWLNFPTTQHPPPTRSKNMIHLLDFFCSLLSFCWPIIYSISTPEDLDIFFTPELLLNLSLNWHSPFGWKRVSPPMNLMAAQNCELIEMQSLWQMIFFVVSVELFMKSKERFNFLIGASIILWHFLFNTFILYTWPIGSDDTMRFLNFTNDAQWNFLFFCNNEKNWFRLVNN